MDGCVARRIGAVAGPSQGRRRASAEWRVTAAVHRVARCSAHTVMKTVRCIEYEQQEVTCYKTCWERVCEDRVINCTKYVPETRTREVCYTVCKPVWETKTRCYTVCKPVWETKTRRRSATRCASRCGKPGPAATRCASRCGRTTAKRSATRSASRCGKPRPAATRCASRSGKPRPATLHGVQAGVGNPHERDLLHGLQAGVGRPAPAATRCASRCGKPRPAATRCASRCGKTKHPRSDLLRSQAGELHEDDHGPERPLGNRDRTRFRARSSRRVVREPGTWVYNPCTCRCCYCPGKCHAECCQCPPRKCCKKVWVPTCVEKEICCTKYVCEPRTKTCCYKVCKMVPEEQDLLLQGLQDGAGATDLLLQGLQDGAGAADQDLLLQGLQDGARNSGPAATRSARWCRRQRTCCYKVCKMVPEQRTRTVCWTRPARWFPRPRTCCYKVCKMVPEQRTKTCCYKVCKMVPEHADLLLQGLPHGARATDSDGLLHGLQAGVLPEDDPSAGSACRARCRTR